MTSNDNNRGEILGDGVDPTGEESDVKFTSPIPESTTPALFEVAGRWTAKKTQPRTF